MADSAAIMALLTPKKEMIVLEPATRISIVIPCFNESSRMVKGEFERFVTRNPEYSLVLVNDGSTDNTSAVLANMAESNPRLQVLDLPRNVGKAEAVRLGMLRALSGGCQVVGFMDADLATPFSEILAMEQTLMQESSLQAVIASRVMLLGRRIKRHPWRHYLGRVFATCVSLTLNSPVYDTQCGAKLFRVSDALRLILAEAFRSRWIFDVEILARLAKSFQVKGPELGRIVFEYPIMEWRDVEGSKVKAKDFFRSIWELHQIYKTYRTYLF